MGESTVFLLIGILSTGIFLFLLLGPAFGVGADADDVGHHHEGPSLFKIFTMQAVLAFFMGVGWLTWGALKFLDIGSIPSLLVGIFAGALFVWFNRYLTRWSRSLDSVRQRNYHSAIGQIAEVYLPIPENGKGRGQVRVKVDGQLLVLNAISISTAVPSFAKVRVVDVQTDRVLVVENIQEALPHG